KPTNKPKPGETPAKTPTADVRPANDSKRPEAEAAKSPPSQSRKEKGNSTVLLGVSKDWRPAYSKIEVDESRTTLCSALEHAAPQVLSPAAARRRSSAQSAGSASACRRAGGRGILVLAAGAAAMAAECRRVRGTGRQLRHLV